MLVVVLWGSPWNTDVQNIQQNQGFAWNFQEPCYSAEPCNILVFCEKFHGTLGVQADSMEPEFCSVHDGQKSVDYTVMNEIVR